LTTDLFEACPTKDPPRLLVSGVTTAAAPLVSLDSMVADAPDHLDPVGRPADAIAVIAYTADAESVAPKGACHSIADLLATADTYARQILEIGPEDVIGGPISPAFAFGLGAKLVFPLRAGATTVLVENFDAEALSASIGREGMTLLFGTATAYRLLLRAPDCDRHMDFGSLRLAISSGERLDADLAVEWKRRTGVELLDGFGTTEMAHILSQRAGGGGSGQLGAAVPGYDVRVVDDAFADAAAGVAGRLIVRGPTGCRYWRRPEAQRRYVQRGWNVTGDVCVRDDGLRFVGRADD
jgi:2-aminobenzoate-CoA ligase